MLNTGKGLHIWCGNLAKWWRDYSRKTIIFSKNLLQTQEYTIRNAFIQVESENIYSNFWVKQLKLQGYCIEAPYMVGMELISTLDAMVGAEQSVSTVWKMAIALEATMKCVGIHNLRIMLIRNLSCLISLPDEISRCKSDEERLFSVVFVRRRDLVLHSEMSMVLNCA